MPLMPKVIRKVPMRGNRKLPPQLRYNAYSWAAGHSGAAVWKKGGRWILSRNPIGWEKDYPNTPCPRYWRESFYLD